MARNVEGPVSEHVIDAQKIVCPRCNSSNFQISGTLQDPNTITKDKSFLGKHITITDGHFHGLVVLCHCGNEFVPIWYCIDIGTADNAAGTVTMTNLDQGTVANQMTGLYMIPCVGSDIGKYHVVATNTLATPTVITTDIAPADDGDGIWIITNILPLGLILAS